MTPAPKSVPAPVVEPYARAIELVDEVLEMLPEDARGAGELKLARRVFHLAMQTPAERLRIARDNKHLTKTQLAQRAGVTRDTIYKAETDGPETMQLATLAAIAKALGYSVDDILHHGVTPNGKSIFFENRRTR